MGERRKKREREYLPVEKEELPGCGVWMYGWMGEWMGEGRGGEGYRRVRWRWKMGVARWEWLVCASVCLASWLSVWFSVWLAGGRANSVLA